MRFVINLYCLAFYKRISQIARVIVKNKTSDGIFLTVMFTYGSVKFIFFLMNDPGTCSRTRSMSKRLYGFCRIFKFDYPPFEVTTNYIKYVLVFSNDVYYFHLNDYELDI